MQLINGNVVYSATDLVGFLACEHLTNLERASIASLVQRPMRADPQLDRIAMRGEQHEARFLAELLRDGHRVVEIPWDESTPDRAERYRAMAAETMSAIQSGADVVYQATFFDSHRFGRADFLRRVDSPSDLGDWSYEVWDTKLARHARASAVLQLCFYSDLLAEFQSSIPQHMHVALGGSAGETVHFRTADYAAYYRLVSREYATLLASGPAAYPPITRPDPVEHCDVCRWDELCRSTRRAARDLALTAGISSRQKRALRERGIDTLDALAVLPFPLDPPLEGRGEESLHRMREQARLQVAGEAAGYVLSERLSPARTRDGALDPEQGLLMLPAPSAGDLFFDIEGDPFVSDHGLDSVDYLFGVIEPGLPDESGRPTFHHFWSIDADGEVTPAAEQETFERFIDLVMERLATDPGLHIYHYASYEPDAMKRLMGRYGTREDEVDHLLRAGVFVDLYRTVRQGIRASVESYSIKQIEKLYATTWRREADLRTAGDSIVEFETWLETGAGSEDRDALLAAIEAYNRDDCVSTLHLRDWLEEQRQQLAAEIPEALPRPEPRSGDANEELKAELVEIQALVDQLTAGVAADPSAATSEGRARWLLAQLLGWHRREEKSTWWRYYFLKDELTDEERAREPDALGALTAEGSVGQVRRSDVYRFRFPPQDHKIEVGSRPLDPTTNKSAGRVEAIDDEAGWIELSVGRGSPPLEPTSLIPPHGPSTRELKASLRRFAEWVVANGIDHPGPYRAARDLLLRRNPRVGLPAADAALRADGETPSDAAHRLMRSLDESYLAIQGPPGSGKTWLGAELIVDLVAAGRPVGVTATSHKVISQLLAETAAAAARRGQAIRIGQRIGEDNDAAADGARPLPSNEHARNALAAHELDVVGGTAWLWSRDDMAGSVDTLFIDEAGQISLANVMATARAASNLVLLGDPQQLDQPLKGVHPPGADRSALAHLIGDAQTIPPDLGLFLDDTYRLHPAITAFTSELFYNGLLRSHPGRDRQHVVGAGPLSGSGVRFIPVPHAGNDSSSPEEATIILTLIEELLASGASWVNDEGVEQRLTLQDVLVITPYNAQVRQIAQLIPGARVGTVDKFQGQQAPIAIYSMATSSADEAPRGMEFLYSLNRLNVATSRARCTALVVASPHLLAVRCRTPRQMRLANALARFVELAAE